MCQFSIDPSPNFFASYGWLRKNLAKVYLAVFLWRNFGWQIYSSFVICADFFNTFLCLARIRLVITSLHQRVSTLCWVPHCDWPDNEAFMLSRHLTIPTPVLNTGTSHVAGNGQLVPHHWTKQIKYKCTLVTSKLCSMMYVCNKREYL